MAFSKILDISFTSTILVRPASTITSPALRPFSKASEDFDIPVQVNRFGSMINPFFTKDPVTDFPSAQKSDTEIFKLFFWEMIQQGLFIPPSQFESWFLCSSLSKDEVKNITSGIRAAVKKVSETLKVSH